MIGILVTIKSYIAMVFQFGDWILLGAALALAGALFRGFLGYVGVSLAGAVIMFFALTGHWLGDDSDRIKRLEAELEAKKAELAITRATGEQLAKDLEAENEAAEVNAAIIADLKVMIDALPDSPECGVSEEFTDALKNLR